MTMHSLAREPELLRCRFRDIVRMIFNMRQDELLDVVTSIQAAVSFVNIVALYCKRYGDRLVNFRSPMALSLYSVQRHAYTNG